MYRSKIPFLLFPALMAHEAVQAAQAVDDASRLNNTIVSEIIDIRTVNDVKLALIKARALKKHISIAGRRHSMGGQTFAKDNIVLNMLPFRALAYDEKSGILTAQAGASWAQIQEFLDPKGRSVWVMQSDTIFTVGGTLSVNAHGWQPRQGPVSSTVESFRMMLATGEIKECSRRKNAELFRAALGGYGLLGVIMDARLKTVPNKLYSQRSYFFPAEHYAAMFDQHVTKNPAAELAYARLSIDRQNFLAEVGLHTFEAANAQPSVLPSMQEERLVNLKNFVFRRSARNDAGKQQRWTLEKRLAAYRADQVITRNTVMHPDSRVAWRPTADSRHILHEYFVPYPAVTEFIASLRGNVQKHDLNLLNVTLRDVRKDNDTLLAYAKTDVCALVLFFSQPPTPEAEETMRQFTLAMAERAIALHGSFYLPYRPHYSVDQFRNAYPHHAMFMQLKKTYDPEPLFSSQFSTRNLGGMGLER